MFQNNISEKWSKAEIDQIQSHYYENLLYFCNLYCYSDTHNQPTTDPDEPKKPENVLSLRIDAANLHTNIWKRKKFNQKLVYEFVNAVDDYARHQRTVCSATICKLVSTDAVPMTNKKLNHVDWNRLALLPTVKNSLETIDRNNWRMTDILQIEFWLEGLRSLEYTQSMCYDKLDNGFLYYLPGNRLLKLVMKDNEVDVDYCVYTTIDSYCFYYNASSVYVLPPKTVYWYFLVKVKDNAPDKIYLFSKQWGLAHEIRTIRTENSFGEKPSVA